MSIDQIVNLSPATLILFALFVVLTVTQKKVEASTATETAAAATQTAAAKQDSVSAETQLAFVNFTSRRLMQLEDQLIGVQTQLDLANKSNTDKSLLITELQDRLDEFQGKFDRILRDIESKDREIAMKEEENLRLQHENEALRHEKEAWLLEKTELLARARAAEERANTMQEVIDRLTPKPSTGSLDPSKAPVTPPEGTDHA